MASVNKVILIGNVSKDPEFREIKTGSVVNFSVATSEVYKTKDGTKKEDVHFHNLQAWGKLADIVNDYVKKGDRLFIEGVLTYEHYEDKEGNKRTATRIRVKELVMLGGGKKEKTESAPEPEVSDGPKYEMPF